MKKKSFLSLSYIVTTSILLSIPLLSLAQSGPPTGFGGIGRIVDTTLDFINYYLVPAVFAIAFLVFIWGLFQYFIYGGANEDSREKGKQLAVYGVIGFVIMVSVWGLVNVIANGLGFSGGNAPQLPKVQGGSSNNQQTTALPPTQLTPTRQQQTQPQNQLTPIY
jgi:hypothetical protein